ncbi:MAG TPA: DNA polymerase III subunit delta [Spirochaetota bacterium]|nr:DNA polymerase III subunit delta [Spirochaetota bacterium]
MQKNILLFNGKTDNLLKDKIKEIKKKYIPAEMQDLACSKFYAEETDPGELRDTVTTPAFGSDYKLVTVYNYNKYKNISSLIQALNECADYCFLLLSQDDKTIKNQKLAAAVKKLPNAAIISVARPDTGTLHSEINSFFQKKKLNITSAAAVLLAEHFQQQEHINLEPELEKISLYFQNRELKQITAEEIEIHLSQTFAAVPFTVVNNFMIRKKKATLLSLRQYIRSSGKLIPLQVLLFRSVTTLIKYLEMQKNNKTPPQIMKELKLNYYRRQKINKEASAYNLPLLYKILYCLSVLETILKTGSITAARYKNKINLEGLYYLERLIIYYCL